VAKHSSNFSITEKNKLKMITCMQTSNEDVKFLPSIKSKKSEGSSNCFPHPGLFAAKN